MSAQRLLIVDDNEEIHKDFKKILGSKAMSNEINEMSALLFSDDDVSDSGKIKMPAFDIDSAFQGEQGLECVREANSNNRPYALAFVDVRMPPGWDGIYTIEQLWKIDPDLQVVICTAYSDHAFEDIYQRLKGSDNFLILKKPFDIIEMRQITSTLTKKWELSKQARLQINQQKSKIEHSSQESEFLFHLSNLSQSELKIRSTLEFFIKGICELQDWPIGHVYKIKNQKKSDNKVVPLSVPFHLWSLKDAYASKDIQAQVIEASSSLVDKVLLSGRSCWMSDVTDKPFPMLGIEDAFALPIKINDKIIAIAEFYAEKTISKSQELQDFFLTAANQLGSLFEKRKNEIELKKNYSELKQLYQELQSTQSQLVQHSKLVAIGQLAAGVAHEINNPIAYIASNTRSLQEYMATIQSVLSEIDKQLLQMNSNTVEQIKTFWKDLHSEKNLTFIQEDIDSLLKECSDGLERVKEIVTDLITFSHTDEGDIQQADINACIDITLKMIWNELKYKCVVNKDYGDLPKIFCNPRQLNQVFMNLLVNAAQAIPEKGEINIKTRVEDAFVKIEIQDTGSGILPEHMEKLFDPFFTTKPVGTGTGLGLSISYNIVKKHEGRIEVKSKVGQGTVFIIYIPVKKSESKNQTEE